MAKLNLKPQRISSELRHTKALKKIFFSDVMRRHNLCPVDRFTQMMTDTLFTLPVSFSPPKVLESNFSITANI